MTQISETLSQGFIKDSMKCAKNPWKNHENWDSKLDNGGFNAGMNQKWVQDIFESISSIFERNEAHS